MKLVILFLLGTFVTPLFSVAQITITRDNNGNVLTESYPNGFTISYAYDANGNRISQMVSGVALPVTLIEFTATKQANDVLLQWTTSQEVNTDKFVVEFSKDATSFVPFDTVLAHGNSSTVLSYSTIHCCPVEGLNYYRLKMIDKDGKFTYSPVRVVSFSNPNDLRVYPNPASTETITLEFAKNISKGVIEIYNSSGQLVITRNLVLAGLKQQINISALPKGTYYILAKSETENYTKAFIKQ